VIATRSKRIGQLVREIVTGIAVVLGQKNQPNLFVYYGVI